MRLVKFSLLLGAFSLLVGCGMEDPAGRLGLGMEAPSLRTKFIDDVGGDLSRLTSYRHPDARMYQYSVDDALALNKTIVIEFATPGHCTVCDKQLQMLKAVIDKYGKDVVFLHMDQYMNPEAFISYRIKGDPWTFIIDTSGTVVFRRPGRLLYGELDGVLGRILAGQKG